jgi:dihydrolipoamide dehydrogenase
MKYDYDVVVIGAGAAGLVAATGTAGLGARTALIEKKKLGGDCTWFGCIPSKAILKSAQVYSLVRRLEDFGLSAKGGIVCDTANVMAHAREIINKVASGHSVEVFEKRGIKVMTGQPLFVDNRTIELNGTAITSKRFIIATGSSPFIPEISGLKDIPYLTNENVFSLDKLPGSIVVLGGGAIGVELSQAFNRLGVEVSIVEMLDRLLFREDLEAAGALVNDLIREGIKVYAGWKAIKVSGSAGNIKVTIEDKNKQMLILSAENILVAVGRGANVAGLGLEKAGVKYSNKAIEVDDTLRSSAPNIYACGDVAGPYLFSHMAEYQAIIAAGNALFPFKRKVDYRAVAWCTFTEPELAHLGLTEEEAREKYGDIRVYKAPYSQNDRAITDLEGEGFAKVICDSKGRILGAHIFGASAGELIHEYVLAKSSGLRIKALSSAIHIYPTLAQVVKRSADGYYFDLMKSNWFKVLTKFMLKFLR